MFPDKYGIRFSKIKNYKIYINNPMCLMVKHELEKEITLGEIEDFKEYLKKLAVRMGGSLVYFSINLKNFSITYIMNRRK